MTGPGMSTQIIVRPMALDDIPQVRNIDQISFSLPWPERSYRFEITENTSSRAWVAEQVQENGERQIVAMIVAWLILDETHIGTFAVHPNFRRAGVGRLLMAKTLLTAYEDGARICYLEVRRSNQPAIRLYEMFGFIQTSVRARYYRDNNEDALLMTLDPIVPEKIQALLERPVPDGHSGETLDSPV